MLLYAKTLAPPEPTRGAVAAVAAGVPLVILHGLFGMSDNWQTLARRFAERRTVVLLDLRNHGQSPHDPAHDYPAMAGDVAETVRHLGYARADVLGHSMGGKVAMRLALDTPGLVRRLVVVDMGVRAFPGGHERYFAAMRNLPIADPLSRKQVDARLAETVDDPGIRMFLMKNLRRERTGGYAWKLNLEALEANYASILAALEAPAPSAVPALFVRGGRSHYVRDEDWPAIAALFPRATLTTVAGAGHWVHAEAPGALREAVTAFLDAEEAAAGRHTHPDAA